VVENSTKSATARLGFHLLPVLLLVVATFVVYGQILGHDFIRNWDDNRYVLENVDIQGFGLDNIKAVFTRYYVGNYAPAQMLSYMLDHALWGLKPGGYLFTNLLLHTLNGLLLYKLFFRLIGGRLAAWSGAALFLLHPVQVETVAWVSQRKTLLAMFFFLLAWKYYIAWREHRSQKARMYYIASLLSLMLAMLSKSIAVIFPVIMVFFDYCYPVGDKRFCWRDKLPYCFVALLAAAVAILSQTPDPTEWGAGGGRAGYHGGSAVTTVLSMLPVFCRYLGMILWPGGLAALYDPRLHPTPDLSVLAAMLLLAAVVYLAVRLFRHERSAGFWPLFFLVALLPVSQIIPLVTMMNDRYLYFPMIGIAALAGYGINFLDLQRRVKSRTLVLIAIIPLLSLAIVSFLRVGVWKEAVILWQDAVSKSPGSALAWESLGEAHHHALRPDREAAKRAYHNAIRIAPGNELSRYNLGTLYIELNDFANADQILWELLQISPQNVMGWAAYGDLAFRQLDYAEAEKRYKRAQELQPEAVQILRKLGNLMVITDRFIEAKSAYLRIEELQGGSDPLNAYELALVESLAGNASESIRWLELALRRGYTDYAAIMNFEELAPVRADGRFPKLMKTYFPNRGD
jgi:Tfp pilus assembly protein PilF